MRIYISLVATASNAVTFTIADWRWSAAEVALSAVVVGTLAALGMLAVSKVERVTRAARADWHTRRGRDLGQRGAAVSGILPLAWAVALALALVEWAHVLRAEELAL